MALILASASPRRHQLLQMIGLEFEARIPEVDESWVPGEDAAAYVARIARLKVDTTADAMGRPADTCVLGADTTVAVDGEILAKPTDDEDARRMLRLLSGRTHQVHTTVVGWTAEIVRVDTVTTDVTFARLSDQGIEWYLSMGEHLDKAGAYGMQGAGGALVLRIDGSPTNVIGLPLAETIGVLRACGVIVVGG